jgi:hypothetical protein
MKSKEYLPHSFVLLLNWLTNFLSYLLANYSRFGISSSKITPLQTKANEFQASQTKAEHPNAGKADRLNRKEKAEAVSKAVRSFVNANLRFNEAVTDEDRVNMGLTVPDTIPTPSRDPNTIPVVIKTDSSVIMRIKLQYKDSGSEARGLPDDVHGAEIRSAILEEPPKSTDELIHSDFSTRSSYTFVFDEQQRGKTVWFRLRWENMRGHKGPWSELYSAIVP